MSIVTEEIVHEEFPATIMTLERTKGEFAESWRFIQVEIDTFGALAPKELRELGSWLVHQGARIGREYTSKGAKKTVAADNGEEGNEQLPPHHR